MHATIASFSAGVPVIPFSYSRKFEGLFHSLGYDYVISGTGLTTDEAVNKTLEYLKDYKMLRDKIEKSKELLEYKNKLLFERTEDIIMNQR